MGDFCIPSLNPDPHAIAAVIGDDDRVLLFGAPGAGKSTLASALAGALTARQAACLCLNADPGSPAFGPPGALCLGRWSEQGWAQVDLEPLCTLDAGRFRLPLVDAVRRLLARTPPGVLLVDGPGVVRGVAGAELLDALLGSAGIDLVLALQREGQALPLADELGGLGAAVKVVPTASAAVAAGKRARARARTARWDQYLAAAESRDINLSAVNCLGTPPPRDTPNAWLGRQIALLRDAKCIAFGEVTRVDSDAIRAELVGEGGEAEALLVRDAMREANGLLGTAKPFGSRLVGFVPPPDTLHTTAVDTSGPRPVARVGPVTAILVNGVFGDPLLHVRFRHQRRSLLFDLGDGARLPARIAHQVTDVFISHAHIDHVAGFLWLLRSRIGETGVCRLFGPPGISANIEGLVAGIHWDRIGTRGPRFEIGELHGEVLRRFSIQAGQPAAINLGEAHVTDGLLIDEPGFVVRAITLDHRTPVLAFALEPAVDIKVRKERLDALGLTPGRWLTALKTAVAAGQNELPLQLPDGSTRTAAELTKNLLLIRPGRKLVYATDLADTVDNRTHLARLARQAHTLFCEAAFCEVDTEQATRTGHLTARACGEIAASAAVEHLIPFHFSRRYSDDPGQVYREARAVCAATVVPPRAGGGE